MLYPIRCEMYKDLNKMDEIKELLSKCKASVSITVNQHRNYHQSVKQYIEEQAQLDDELIEEIGLCVYEEMKKTDTIIEIHAYPHTPIGSYLVIHHDIDKAVRIVLDYINAC